MRELAKKEFKRASERLAPLMGEDIERLTQDRCRYLEQSHQVVAVDDDGDNECRVFVFDIDEEKFSRPVICVVHDKAYAIEELIQALAELGDEMIWFHLKLAPLYSD